MIPTLKHKTFTFTLTSGRRVSIEATDKQTAVRALYRNYPDAVYVKLNITE